MNAASALSLAQDRGLRFWCFLLVRLLIDLTTRPTHQPSEIELLYLES